MTRSLIVLAVLALVGCSAEASTTEVPDLTEEYGCGYGFWVGAADQTAGLYIEYSDFEGANEGEVVDSAELAGDVWNAYLQAGTDLFANWCDDVIEPDEPEPTVDEVWQVSGRIDIGELPAEGCGPASASLTDVVAHDEDGNEIRLGDLDVRNEFWGCFAG